MMLGASSLRRACLALPRQLGKEVAQVDSPGRGANHVVGHDDTEETQESAARRIERTKRLAGAIYKPGAKMCDERLPGQCVEGEAYDLSIAEDIGAADIEAPVPRPGVLDTTRRLGCQIIRVNGI